MQETNLKNLVINKVESQEVYDVLKTNGQIQSDELYLVGGGSSVDSVNGQTGDVNLDIPVVHKVESQDTYDEMAAAGQVNAGELYLVKGYEKELILASSTSGSTKKFKITVDDNGAISVTEI